MLAGADVDLGTPVSLTYICGFENRVLASVWEAGRRSLNYGNQYASGGHREPLIAWQEVALTLKGWISMAHRESWKSQSKSGENIEIEDSSASHANKSMSLRI